nr:MAG TPA: hypothetical protein [Caudoviricetes sp.]
MKTLSETRRGGRYYGYIRRTVSVYARDHRNHRPDRTDHKKEVTAAPWQVRRLLQCTCERRTALSAALFICPL